jgi:hypothetical protein
VEQLLYAEPGDDRRISKVREALKRTHSHAHLSCFWRGNPGEPSPQIPDPFRSAIAPLAAYIETDFAIGKHS